MHRYWRIYAILWVCAIGVSLAGAYFSTRPKYDTLAQGAVTERREVRGIYLGTQTFAYEQSITYQDVQGPRTVTYTTKLPLPVHDAVWVSYDSRNPGRYEFYDSSAFRHVVQMIAVVVLMMAGFSAFIVRSKVIADLSGGS